MKYFHSFASLSVSCYMCLSLTVLGLLFVVSSCGMFLALSWPFHSSGEEQRERRGCCGFSVPPLTLCSDRRVLIRVFAESSGQQDLQENCGHQLCPRPVAFGVHMVIAVFLTKWEKTAPSLTFSIAKISIPHHFQLVLPENCSHLKILVQVSGDVTCFWISLAALSLS